MVTGASGFLGKTIVGLLNENKIDVIPVCRYKSKDIKNIHLVDNYTETPSGDVLIYLAESANVFQANEKKEVYIHENINRIESILNNHYKKVIYFSSAVVYGDKSDRAHNPDDVVSPESWYAEAKVACEKIVLQDSSKNIIVRLSNIYGPFMSNQNVIADILRQRDESTPVFVQNDKPVRDFLWSGDVAQCICKMSLSDYGGVYNLGSGCSVSIRKLAEIICSLWGMTDRKIISETNKYRESNILLNIQTTKDVFDWKPEMPLKKGLAELIKRS